MHDYDRSKTAKEDSTYSILDNKDKKKGSYKSLEEAAIAALKPLVSKGKGEARVIYNGQKMEIFSITLKRDA